MRASAKRGASVAIILALVVFVWFVRIPLWIGYPTFFVVGLVFAALAVRWYFRLPPSRERFRRVGDYGGRSAAGFMMVGMLVLVEFYPRIDPWVRYVSFMAILTAFAGYLAWYNLTLQHYGRRRPHDPDFGEDDEGNPVPLKPPD